MISTFSPLRRCSLAVLLLFAAPLNSQSSLWLPASGVRVKLMAGAAAPLVVARNVSGSASNAAVSTVERSSTLAWGAALSLYYVDPSTFSATAVLDAAGGAGATAFFMEDTRQPLTLAVAPTLALGCILYTSPSPRD